MNLDDLVSAWKKHDDFLKVSLRDDTLIYLLKEKSQTMLQRMRAKLTRESFLVLALLIVFDVLFFLVDIPLGFTRVASFLIVNLTLMLHLGLYINAIRKCKLLFNTNLKVNLERIVHGLSKFEHRHKLFNVPVFALCIVMFAVSVNYFLIIPWMILELFLWKTLFKSKAGSKYSDHLSDLKFTLRQIETI